MDAVTPSSRKSYGKSLDSKVLMISDTLLFYISGNCINAIDLNQAVNDGDTAVQLKCRSIHEESHIKILEGKTKITTFSVSLNDSLLACSEMYANVIKVYQLSGQKVTYKFKLEVLNDLSIVDVDFSSDGLYFVSLGSLPTFTITIWNLKEQEVIAKCPNGGPASSISFNCADSTQLCTSSPSDELRFWTLKVWLTRYDLYPNSDLIESKVPLWTDPFKDDELKPQLTLHQWILGDQILSIDRGGRHIYQFKSLNDAKLILYTCEDGSTFTAIAQNAKYLFIGYDNGRIDVFNLNGELVGKIPAKRKEGIKSLKFSPDYQSLLIESTSLYLMNFEKETRIEMNFADYTNVVDMASIDAEKAIFSYADGTLIIRDIRSNNWIHSSQVNYTISAMRVGPNLVAIGSVAGVLRMYDSSEPLNLQLVHLNELCQSQIRRLEFTSDGFYLAVVGLDCVWILDCRRMTLLGLISIQGLFNNMKWDSSFLYILQSSSNNSEIIRYLVCQDSFGEDRNYILSEKNHLVYTLPEPSLDFFVAPPSNEIQVIYVLDTKNNIKVYSPVSTGLRTNIGPSVIEYKDRESGTSFLSSDPNREYILSCGSDGAIFIRNLLDPDASIKLIAHFDGVSKVSFIGEYLVTIGFDGLMSRWNWTKVFNKSSTPWPLRISKPQIEDIYTANIEAGDEASDIILVIPPTREQGASGDVQVKVKNITDQITELIRLNEEAPETERVSREDFIIDLKERDRLKEETELEIQNIKKEQEGKNLTLRVLRNRIKKECWDGSLVVGQSIKSFRVIPMLTAKLAVTNYPIRRQTESELLRISKLLRMRRLQLKITDTVVGNTNESLLYNPFELTSKDRRVLQTVILAECIQDIKIAFNDTFVAMIKVKLEEMAKIEEKNDRIVSILEQLQLTESIFHPSLEDDEVPERIIQVLESEVSFSKIQSKEELERLRLIEAEKQFKIEWIDNTRSRALMQMMGGRLEDRKAQEEKDKIVKPDWMSKSKDEMNEVERKAVKEFERKVLVFKEEQEKHRKALETEYRKLQVSVLDCQDLFDVKLQAFFRTKLESDSAIYRIELSMIKQTQFAITGANDLELEDQLVKQITKLQKQKKACINEIPALQKQVEAAREDYDLAVKRDKDLEKQLKREFSGYDGMYDAIHKLFKRRSVIQSDKQENFNPFKSTEVTIPAELNPLPLNNVLDIPDGLHMDGWTKLVEMRDKKVLSEGEVYQSNRKFRKIQLLIQNNLEASESFEANLTKNNQELTLLLDFKFRNRFNVESLFILKQGQLEIPQAPITSNYEDAVLLHRSFVDKLNDQVKVLGNLKVDALTEMKEYRKGLHLLEWQSKMHDFQAEDLVIRAHDIQSLKLTKGMQEFLRGEESRLKNQGQGAEKVVEASLKAHAQTIEKLRSATEKLKRERLVKMKDNVALVDQVQELSLELAEKNKLMDVKKIESTTRRELGGYQIMRRKMVDLIKSQSQDLDILKQERDKLRLATYPAFQN